MELEVGGYQRSGEFGVGGGAGSGAPDFGGEVVQFFAVLEGGKKVGLEGFCLR